MLYEKHRGGATQKKFVNCWNSAIAKANSNDNLSNLKVSLKTRFSVVLVQPHKWYVHKWPKKRREDWSPKLQNLVQSTVKHSAQWTGQKVTQVSCFTRERLSTMESTPTPRDAMLYYLSHSYLLSFFWSPLTNSSFHSL